VIYYANPSTEPVKDAISAGRLGCITSPKDGHLIFPDDGWEVVADNGCFSNKWEHDRWLRWLLDVPRTIRFAVAPDVYDPTGAPCHEATLERWRTYGPLIERHGFTPAFVCQVGATVDNIPDAAVYFLGGTTTWKLGPDAEQIAVTTRERGAWVHMGRVNTLRRLRVADDIGCHSVDGTYLTFGPDINLPRLFRFLDAVDAQPTLRSAWRSS
jgi:hypothetical protein